MCKCVRLIESTLNRGLSYPEAIVISVFIVCATIIIYKLISATSDLTYIICREDKSWYKRVIVLIILAILAILAFIISLYFFS